MRTETELILKSRRVEPARLLEHGFTFDDPHWPDAARDLCRQPRVLNGTDTGSRWAHTVSGAPWGDLCPTTPRLRRVARRPRPGGHTQKIIARKRISSAALPNSNARWP